MDDSRNPASTPPLSCRTLDNGYHWDDVVHLLQTKAGSGLEFDPLQSAFIEVIPQGRYLPGLPGQYILVTLYFPDLVVTARSNITGLSLYADIPWPKFPAAGVLSLASRASLSRKGELSEEILALYDKNDDIHPETADSEFNQTFRVFRREHDVKHYLSGADPRILRHLVGGRMLDPSVMPPHDNQEPLPEGFRRIHASDDPLEIEEKYLAAFTIEVLAEFVLRFRDFVQRLRTLVQECEGLQANCQ